MDATAHAPGRASLPQQAASATEIRLEGVSKELAPSVVIAYEQDGVNFRVEYDVVGPVRF